MADKRYELNTLEEICRDLDGDLPSVEQYFEHHDLRADGLWVRLLKRREWPQLLRHEFAWLEWHPLGNLELPALPIPFTARQLTAFALGGRAEFILEVGTDLAVKSEDETDAAFQLRFGLTADEAKAVRAKPHPPELLESNALMALGANADKAREALREVHRLYAECVERFGVSDEGVREAAEWLYSDEQPVRADPQVIEPSPSVSNSVEPTFLESVRVVRHSIKSKCRDVLVPSIEAAQQNCQTPTDAAEVFAQLQRMANEELAPLLAATGRGIKYTDKHGNDAYLTKDALDKRLRRASRVGPLSPPNCAV
jgi:hypothetical protein